MRAANITAGIAVALWLGLAVLGRKLLDGVIAQKALGYPNMGQINYYVVWPLFIVSALLLCAWLCNAFQRWPKILGTASGIALLAILPYLMAWAGGI